MIRFTLRRLGLSIFTLFLIVTIVFLINNVLPDDPGRRIAGPFAPQETVDIINERIGANDPLGEQYVRLLRNTVTFDFGNSFARDIPVTDLLVPALGRSARLVALGLILTVPISIAGGVYAARRRDTFADRAVVTFGLASASIPEFVSGVVLQFIVAVQLGWLPAFALAPADAGFFEQLRFLVLPAVALVIVYFGYIARITRAGTILALDSDYTRTARMKGLSKRQVLWRHVMRNALQPTVSVIGVQVGYLFAGLIGLEVVFNYPGLGRLIFTAVGDKDFPVLTAAVILVGAIYMIMTLVADLIIAWMNPRTRMEGGRV